VIRRADAVAADLPPDLGEAHVDAGVILADHGRLPGPADPPTVPS